MSNMNDTVGFQTYMVDGLRVTKEVYDQFMEAKKAKQQISRPRHYEKLKKYRGNARRAIKDLLAKNEMITALYRQELSLNAQLRAEHRDEYQKLFRFAKWVYPKLIVSSEEPGTWQYSKEVSKWLHKWEKEIDQRSYEQATTKEA